MICPICGRYDRQNCLGNLGTDAVIRCGYCGAQYYGKIPVISESEWGSFRDDGNTDMKALRKRAEGAVRYFNNGNPRTEMHTNIFGYPFSIIDNGKLVDSDNAYRGNVIIRCLSYSREGFYSGKVTLSYNDDYNDGRGQGGSGCMLINDVKAVRIDGDELVISGMNGRQPAEYRYRIQEHPDTKAFVKPVPRKKIEEKPAPAPKRRTLDDYGRTRDPLEGLPQYTDETYDGYMWIFQRDTVTGFRGNITYFRGTGVFESYFWFDGPGDEDLRGKESVDTFPTYGEAYEFLDSMNDSAYELMGIRTDKRGHLEVQPPKGKGPKKEKSQPKRKPEIRKKPESKKESKKTGSVLKRKVRKEQVFEVRVDGVVQGSFSSKSKADALRKELKAKGMKAKVVGVYC